MPARKTLSLPTKYIFVSGGVISGIGKGTTAASIALLLKSAGYKIAPIKFENYLNIDAGTINPIEHGDPFLCEDGTEADMDIGSYEKFLNEDMGKENFVTAGQIYKTVIDRERRFEYDGEDVEAIPYITNEIISRIENLAKQKKADIVIIELGGTAGEYQNVFYYEASRMMTLKKPNDVIHIHVSYVPTPTDRNYYSVWISNYSLSFFFYFFGINPACLDVYTEFPPGMVYCVEKRGVRIFYLIIPRAKIFSNYCNFNLLFSTFSAFDEFYPIFKICFSNRKSQFLHYFTIQPLLIKDQGYFVYRRQVRARNHVFFMHIAEKGKSVFSSFV